MQAQEKPASSPSIKHTFRDPLRQVTDIEVITEEELNDIRNSTYVISVWRWNSQPTLKYGMHADDFMLSSSILLSWNNYGKVALLFKFMNLGIVHRTTFFKIQDVYCVDAIEDYWDDKSTVLMDNDSKEIISIVNIDKRETQKNSVIMEEAFIRTFETLHQEIGLQEFCTDAHSQISALFNPTKGRFKPGHLAWVPELGEKKSMQIFGQDFSTMFKESMSGHYLAVNIAPYRPTGRRSGSRVILRPF
ncbi:unnamed protein product [Boreogadus saida]